MASPSRADHRRSERAHRVDRSTEVHPESKVPVLVSRLVGRADEIEAGVAAKQIDPSVPATDTLGARAPLLSIADVENQRQDHSTLRAEGRYSRFERTRAHIRNDYLHSGVDACTGDTQADAARSAGNERNLVPEMFHGFTPGVLRRA